MMTYLSYPKRFSVDAWLVDAIGQGFRAGRSAQAVGPIDFLSTLMLGDLHVHNPTRLDASTPSLGVHNELTKGTS